MSYMGGGGVLEYSDAVAAKIDGQISYLLDSAHQQAYDILAEHRDYLDSLAEALLEKETLRRPDLEALFDGIEPRESHEVFPGESARFPAQAGREPVKTPVEIAIERGEEPPRRFTLLDASRQARERRLALEEAAENSGNESDADKDSQEKSANEPEIGFNFGQHAGDWTEEGFKPAKPQKPSFAMSEPKAHAETAPKPSLAMSEPKDSKSEDPKPEAPKQKAEDKPAERKPAERPSVEEKPAEAEKKSERRPSEDDTTEIPIGRHHKPPMSDDEGWQSPGFNNRDASRNPYAPQPEANRPGANEPEAKQPEQGKDRHPGEDNY